MVVNTTDQDEAQEIKEVLEAEPNGLHVQACPQSPFLREKPVSTMADSR